MKKISATQQFRELEQTIDAFIKQTESRLIEELRVPLPGFPLYHCVASPRWCKPDEAVEEWTVTGVSILFPGTYGHARPRVNKIARLDNLVALRDYFHALQSAEPDLLIHVDRLEKYGRVQRGVRGKDIDGVKYAWTPEDLAPTIERYRREYEENYAPREGCVACERCGKQVPADKVVRYKLIYQGRDQYGNRRVMDRVGSFCSGECAANEQMSLEG